MLTPAAILFGGWAACRQAGIVHGLAPEHTSIVGPAIFIAAITLAVALPLLYRVRFVKSVQGQDAVDTGDFLPFQLNLTTLARLAP